MNYRTIYDVRDDGLFAGHGIGLVFLGFAVFWTTFWVLFPRVVRGFPPERRRHAWKGTAVGVLFMFVGGIVVGSTTVPAIRDQARCREWIRAGDHETTTGVISESRRDAGKNAAHRFRVQGVDFAYWGFNSPKAGFQGKFTIDGVGHDLRDGLSVRISHRDTRILRIEAAE